MTSFVVNALLPPASLAVVALLLLLFGGRQSRVFASVLIALLVLLGTPVVSDTLLNSLALPSGPIGPAPTAIVILSADAIRSDGAIDLAPAALTLERVTAGAMLQRRTGLPVLVAGGPFEGAQTTLAGMMVETLQKNFGISARWREDKSRDTWENATGSAAILKREGVTRVYLVTHFWHMRRAFLAFRGAGLDPVPAPVRPPAKATSFSVRQLLVQTSAWQNSYYALHEWIGLLYYRLRS